MGKIYVCVKELNFGIPNEIIKPGIKFTVIRQNKNRYILENYLHVYEIYDWALKEYFEEVV